MRAWRRASAAALVGVVVVGGPLPAHAEGEPIVVLGAAVVAPGDVLRVSGEGWEPGELVRLELCGNLALDATADCDVPRSVDAGVHGDGTFTAALHIGTPPTPCPCVIRLSGPTRPVPVSVAIEVLGLPTSEPMQRVPSVEADGMLEISEVDVGGTGPVASWFGGPAQRTVRFVVRNVGPVPLENVGVRITVGRGANPTRLVPVPDIDRLEPGEARDLVSDLELDSLSFGRYTVRVALDGLGEPVVARAGTSTYPWALVILALVLAQLGLVVVRNRLRARIVREEFGEDEAIGSVLDEPHDGASPHPDASLQAIDRAASPLPSGPLGAALAEASLLRERADITRREAEEALREARAARHVLVAEGERIIAERLDQAAAVAEQAASLLAEARRRADDLLSSAELRAREIRAEAERHRAEARHVLERAEDVDDALLAETERRVRSLLSRVEGAAVDLVGRVESLEIDLTDDKDASAPRPS